MAKRKNKAADTPPPRRLRIGLALGSGAARGWAHIGVLRTLIAADLEPDIVCGTSVGAAVGAAYVSGTLDQMEDWVRSLRWRHIVRLMDLRLGGGGFIGGDRIISSFAPYLADVAIEDLPKRFAAVATNLAKGHEVWFRDGPLLDGVRASIALPGVFTPVLIRGQWLVDGALVNPIPVSVCRALGADIVIAVNLNGDILGRRGPDAGNHAASEAEQIQQSAGGMPGTPVGARASLLRRLLGGTAGGPGLFDVMFASLAVVQDRITRSRLAGDPPDVILVPRVGGFGMMEFDRAAALIEEGALCAEGHLDEIRDTIAYFG